MFYIISFQWAFQLIIKVRVDKNTGMENVLQDIVDNDHSMAAAQIEHSENNAIEMSVDDVLVKNMNEIK